MLQHAVNSLPPDHPSPLSHPSRVPESCPNRSPVSGAASYLLWTQLPTRRSADLPAPLPTSPYDRQDVAQTIPEPSSLVIRKSEAHRSRSNPSTTAYHLD